MIDIFALALSHGLILLAVWRIVGREDFDVDLPVDEADAPTPKRETSPRA